MFLGNGAGVIATGAQNVSLGQDSLGNLTSGNRNIAIGTGALLAADVSTDPI